MKNKKQSIQRVISNLKQANMMDFPIQFNNGLRKSFHFKSELILDSTIKNGRKTE